MNVVKSYRGQVMIDINRAKGIFDRYGGIVRTYQLTEERIYYADIAYLMNAGLIEKVLTGYYQWIDPDNQSEGTGSFAWIPLCVTMATAIVHRLSGILLSANIPTERDLRLIIRL